MSLPNTKRTSASTRVLAKRWTQASLSIAFTVLISTTAYSANEPNVQPEDHSEYSEVDTWKAFTKALEESGTEILNTYPQPTALDKAEGLRYLLQQLSSVIDKKMVEQDDQIPLLRLGATTINKWGMDGADAKYITAELKQGGQYLLQGTVGTARLTAIQVAKMSGIYQAFGSLSNEQLQASKEGEISVLIAATKPSDWNGAWLELPAQADNLLLREYFSDWNSEQPGNYRLQRINSSPDEQPLSQKSAQALTEEIALMFAERAPQWQGMIEKTRTHLLNKVYVQKSGDQGLATNAYGQSWFSIASDEALLIEMEAPDALMWSIQLGNVWWESIDYINHTASFNDHQSVQDADGKYRFVLSEKDPGIANWLDPAGHSHGSLMFRFQNSNKTIQPTLAVIAFADLDKYLPADTARINQDFRQQQILERRAHAAKRWAP